MRLGSITTNLLNLPPVEGLRLLRELGISDIEVACGGFFDDRAYGDPQRLLSDPEELARWRERLANAEIAISAIAVHGAPLSPHADLAQSHTRDYILACRLAEAVGVTRLTLLAGLPEANPGDSEPTWLVAADPESNADRWNWQWEERVLPYWRKHAPIAEQHGCRLCLEMAPSDFAHNPRGLLMLRAELGPVIGCNFDPSHLWWQGIDPLAALRHLGPAVYHAHAKDIEIRPEAAINGTLDARSPAAPEQRAWNFRTAGYGHDEEFWASYINTLQEIGYDDVLSIEHEDVTVSGDQGLRDAVSFLTPLIAAANQTRPG